MDWLWDIKRLPASEIQSKTRPLIFFDLSANMGQTTEEIINYFPEAYVHAFEPVASTYGLLDQKFCSNTNIYTHNLAVSNQEGEFQSAVKSANSQLSRLVAGKDAHADADQVQSISVDVYCEREGISSVDVLKTDTEGHDLEVLQGAKNGLRSKMISWVLVEVTLDPNNCYHTQFQSIYDFLIAEGMEVYGFYDSHFTHRDYHNLYCNVLFVSKELQMSRV
jgi:FkbM family methyltransferase